MAFNSILYTIYQSFSCYITIPFILILGLFLSYKLKLLQIHKLKLSFSLLVEQRAAGQGELSRLEAVAAVLAGNFGTGNISGIAIALAMGGPGSLIWMWITAFFGMIIQYANCVIAIKYRTITEDGRYVGGPMYYLKERLKAPILATIFALCVIVAAFSVGSFIQVHSIAEPLASFGINPWLTGSVCGGFCLLVALKKKDLLVKTAVRLVPIMALLYTTFSFIILYRYRYYLPAAFDQIISHALHPSSIAAGTLGYTLTKMISTGFHRAILATDTGTGVVSMFQSSVRSQHPVADALSSMTPPFLVLLMCSLTMLVLLVTQAYTSGYQSTMMVIEAFSKSLGKTGVVVVSVSLLLFGYTTLLVWCSCLEKAVLFLKAQRYVPYFFVAYSLCAVGAGFLPTGFIWETADVALGCMTLINLYAIACLGKEVTLDTRAFFLDMKATASSTP